MKRRTLKLIGLLVVSCCLMLRTAAQDSCYDCNPDSLVGVLRNTNSETEKLKLLTLIIDLGPTWPGSIAYIDQLLVLNRKRNTIDTTPYLALKTSLQYVSIGNFNPALHYQELAVDAFDKQKKVIVNLLVDMRISYNTLNLQEERKIFYEKKLQYYLVNGLQKNVSACYFGLGAYYVYKGDFDRAISTYLKANEIFETFYLYYYRNNLAVIGSQYASWGNTDKALLYLNKALGLFEQVGDTSNVLFTLLHLADIYIYKADYNMASQLIKKANYYKAVYPYQAAQVSLYNSIIAFKTNRTTEALSSLKRAQVIADSIRAPIISNHGYLEIDYAYYQYYLSTGNKPAAAQSLLTAYWKALEAKTNQLQLKYLEALFVFYKSNKPAIANQYIEKYLQLKASIEEGQNGQKVAQYETEQKELKQEKRIGLLRQEAIKKDFRIRRRSEILWISLTVLLLVCGLLFFIYRQLRVNKRNLQNLQQTQKQLIQAEKMVSLGELTAGVAHEIQNPLNFINNFSEVSAELLQEVREELDKGDKEEAIMLVTNTIENLQKIMQHGKRADGIVKSMLQHSRQTKSPKEPTDINALTDEYLRLSYHGMRAKDNTLNVAIETQWAGKIGKVNVVGQEMGRVLLNLFNNAFYSVQEKTKLGKELNYEPKVVVRTQQQNRKVIITVQDNGTGITPTLLDKIYQPFFTTKPTGEGTGLGLFLSYDIVVKGHNGNIEVESKEGEGATFSIILPIS